MAKRWRKKETAVSRIQRLPLQFAQVLAITAVILFVYWPALRGGFIWDDVWYIQTNPLLRDWIGLCKFWLRPGSWVEFFPVNETVLWIEYQLWGEHTLGYHLVSVALHTVSVLLVWRLLSRMGLPWAWLGALFFAAHPVQVPSVAWICELKNTLSMPFALLTMIAWIDFEAGGNERDCRRALVFFIVSMLCKITMASFPFIILLYAWWKRGRIGFADLRRAAPFLVISILLAAMTAYSSHVYFRHIHAQPLDLALGDPVTRLLRAATVFWFYLATCLFPFDLTPAYPRWNIGFDTPVAWLSLVALVVFAVWSWRERRTWGRHVLLGLGFFGLSILPFLTLNDITYMVDMWVELHLLYLPVLGVIGLFAAAAEHFSRKCLGVGLMVQVEKAVIAVIALAMIVGAHRYASWYSSEENFWTRALHRNPQAAMACQDIGCFYIGAKRYPEAIAALHRAVALMPGYDYGHYNLGIALEKAGQNAAATEQYREAIRLNPSAPGAYLYLGELDRREGDRDAAAKIFREGFDHAPDSTSLAANLAGLLLEKGESNAALQLYEQAVELSPDEAQLHYNYGSAQLRVGNVPNAGFQFAQAVRLDPHLAVARQSLGAVLAQMGRLPEAIDEFKTALDIDPALGPARDNLARALAQSGRLPEAVEQFQKVLQYHPDDAQAQQNLVRLQQYLQQHPEASGAQ